tara:strand:- start:17525 stop:17941 length:417 start_codon:yes stop_codon:yes gene_type:complete
MVKIRHSGIVVRDLVASLDFYLAFGFSVVSDQLESGKFIDDILGFKDCKVRTVKMVCKNNQMLELLHYKDPKSEDFKKRVNSIGCSHLAFTVEDLESLYISLVEKGVKFINPPAVNEKVKVAFCKDPNDVYLELVEEL